MRSMLGTGLEVGFKTTSSASWVEFTARSPRGVRVKTSRSPLQLRLSRRPSWQSGRRLFGKSRRRFVGDSPAKGAKVPKTAVSLARIIRLTKPSFRGLRFDAQRNNLSAASVQIPSPSCFYLQISCQLSATSCICLQIEGTICHGVLCFHRLIRIDLHI